MRHVVLVVFVALSFAALPASAQAGPSITQPHSIPAGSRLYIAPMGGFEMFLAAAIEKKKIPVQLTLDPKAASFFLLTAEQVHRGWASNGSWSAEWDENSGEAGGHHNAGTTEKFEESILLVNIQTKDVVWAYQTGNEIGGFKTGGRQLQAERWANHFKKIIK